jgi:hypothetical protein
MRSGIRALTEDLAMLQWQFNACCSTCPMHPSDEKVHSCMKLIEWMSWKIFKNLSLNTEWKPTIRQKILSETSKPKELARRWSRIAIWQSEFEEIFAHILIGPKPFSRTHVDQILLLSHPWIWLRYSRSEKWLSKVHPQQNEPGHARALSCFGMSMPSRSAPPMKIWGQRKITFYQKIHRQPALRALSLTLLIQKSWPTIVGMKHGIVVINDYPLRTHGLLAEPGIGQLVRLICSLDLSLPWEDSSGAASHGPIPRFPLIGFSFVWPLMRYKRIVVKSSRKTSGCQRWPTGAANEIIRP